MNKYLSIITLTVNGLNAPIKRHRIAECIEITEEIMTHTFAAYKRPTSEQKTYTNESERLEKTFQASGQEK